jgi:hypothetical protein
MISNPRNGFIVQNGNMANTIVSSPVDLTGSGGCAVQATWSGVSGTGTLYLQASAYPDQSQYAQVSSSAFTVSSVSGNDMWNVTSSKYIWAQLVWAPSGSCVGTLTAVVNKK